MKTSYLLISGLSVALLLILAGCTPAPKTPTEQSLCTQSGGRWSQFPNACADTCNTQLGVGPIACAQVLTMSCDCGEGQCWDGKQCVLNPPKPQPPSDQQTVCRNAGGTWKTFPNGCADTCDYVRNPKNIMCTQALTPGCDCGSNKCWNGDSCVPN